jgi:isoleucyl-tRNA synthetase
MSKSFGNYTDPNELMDEHSADALRFLLMSSPVMSGEDFSLSDKDVADVARKLSMVWNMYDFFTMYAEVDDWEWGGTFDEPGELNNSLDEWIVSRVHQLNQEVSRHMDAYDVPNATKPILPFIDDASNWYVRRSRRRFWKSGDDADKHAAYRTLHYVLVQLAHIMAPFTPFLAEELFQKLTGGESVHLRDWPKAGRVNEHVIEHMRVTRGTINEGLSQRAMFGVKVRQPLQSIEYYAEARLPQEYEDIIAEELNVKDVDYSSERASLVDERGEDHFAGKENQFNVANVILDTDITPELKREGMVRELIRNVQSARKQAGLQIDDRITLSLSTTDQELHKAIEEYTELIAAETLAQEIVHDQHLAFETSCAIEDAPLTVALQKV